MKAFVTGASGFIGSHVVDYLVARGYDVTCLVRSTSKLRWLENSSISLVTGSLDDNAGLRGILKDFDYVFHVAGLTAARNEEEFYRGNRDATKNILDAARAQSPHLKRFVHVSSLAVCGPSSDESSPKTELSECRPISAYGRSKKAAEDEVLAMAPTMPITIVRPPAVYGQRDTAILTFFQTVSRGLAPMIGFDQKKLSLIHGIDLARGIVESAEYSTTVGQTYFISSERFYTWDYICDLTAQALSKDFVFRLRIPHWFLLSVAGVNEAIGRLTNRPQVLNWEKGIDITQRYWICSTDKAQRDFGFAEKISPEDGIRQTVEWYRKNKWL